MVLAILVAVSVWYGWHATVHVVPQPDRYHLSAAVGLATGHGFREPVRPGAALGAFLRGESLSLGWHEVEAAEWRDAPTYLHANRYLLRALAWSWQVTGIRWDALGYLAGAMHAMTVLGTLFLLWMFVPLPVAAAGAGFIAVSTLQLKVIVLLRDYSKSAFIAALLPCVVALALQARDRRALFILSAITGALTGAGIGFKMDVAVILPMALVSIWLFRERRPWDAIAGKTIASIILVSATILASAPVTFGMASDGSNAAHVILLGWAEAFDPVLEAGGAPFRVLPFYSDSYVWLWTQGVAQAREGHMIPFPSSLYDRTSLSLWLQTAAAFPADILTRIVAATNVSLNLVFQNPDPSFLSADVPGVRAMAAVNAWLGRFNGYGALLGIVFVLAASWRDARRGLLAIGLIVAVGGYPFLQFADRHYSHSQIIPVMAIACLGWLLARGAMHALRNRGRLTEAFRISRQELRPLLVVPVTIAIAIAAVTGTRAYQQRSLASEFTKYQQDGLVKMPVQLNAAGPGSVRATWPAPASAATAAPSVTTEHYLLEFESDAAATPVFAGLVYDNVAPDGDFSRVLGLRTATGVNRLAFSVFAHSDQYPFAGVELGADDARRLAGVYWSRSGPAGLPLDLQLPSDWRDRPLHQRLDWESGPESRAPRAWCAGASGCRDHLGYLGAAVRSNQRVGAESVGAILDPIVTVSGDGIAVAGAVREASSYLVTLKDWTPAGAGAMVIHGRLARGGVAVGLLKDDRWHRQVIVTQPGEFWVVLPVDEPGRYSPLVTNAMLPGQRWNQLWIDRVATLAADRLAQ